MNGATRQAREPADAPTDSPIWVPRPWPLRAAVRCWRAVRSYFMGLLSSFIVLLLAAPGASAAQDVFEDTGPLGGVGRERNEAQLFTLLDPSSAAELALRAAALIEAGQPIPALKPLRELIENQGAGVVLTSAVTERTAPEPTPSLYARHLGASAWATSALLSLPDEARAAYEEQVGALATAALERATARVDRGALIQLARRWPASRAASRAWIALGDLELSEGHARSADEAYRRAAELSSGEQVLPRRAALEPVVGEPPLGPGSALGQARAERPLGPLPLGDPDSWTRPLPFGPYNSVASRRAEDFNLFPVIDAESVYVTNSLEVAAFDLYSGTERWRSSEPVSWRRVRRDQRTDYFQSLDRRNALVAPAAGSGVVVAALQVPFTANQNEAFQGLVIRKVLPERRLHAFDAATGRPLWDHAPPFDWDGLATIDFERSMHVAGPPIVHEGRVFVPCIRMEGRVELHVACYDLFDGRKVWQTQVITGQRELNMFNRHQKEYSGAPLAVADGKVLAVTQLGTVAALDAFDGHVLWQSLYDQIPLPPTNGYMPAERRVVWRNGPPLVTAGLVLATPLDSADLTAFDLETGAVRFARSHDQLRPILAHSRCSIDTLLGGEPDRLLVAGDWLAAWRKNGGLGERGSLLPTGLEVELSSELLGSGANPSSSPRALYTGTEVVVPGALSALVFDARDGGLDPAVEIPWTYKQRGNLGVGRGVLVSLRSGELTGFLDLSVLERHAVEQLAAEPGSPRAALSVMRVLARRAAGELADGRSAAALELFARGRAALDGVDFDGQRELERALFENRMSEARVRALEDQRPAAVELFEAAWAGVPDGAAFSEELRLEALLALEDQMRQRDPANWIGVLERLEGQVPTERLDAAALAADPRWIEFLGAAAGEPLRSVPVALWTRVQRALQTEREGDFAAAIGHWQRVLLDHGRVQLTADVPAAEVATGHLGLLLEALGPELYAPWIDAAEAEFEAAAAAGDLAALEALPVRYPFAPAAEQARRLRLDRALAAGDLKTLASATAELLADSPTAAGEGRLGEQDARLLADLAVGFGAQGNRELERALLESLAVDWPELEPREGPFAGRPLGSLEHAPTPEAPPQRPSFGADASVAAVLQGSFDVLGSVPFGGAGTAGQDAARSLLLVHRDGDLEIYGDDDPLQPRSRIAVGLDTAGDADPRFALGDGHAVLLHEGDATAIELATGEVAWTFAAPAGLEAQRVSLGAGLALIACGGERGARDVSLRLFAIDIVHGVPLWEAPLAQRGELGPPLIGRAQVLLLTHDFGAPLQVSGFDLFTGQPRANFTIEAALDPAMLAAATLLDGASAAQLGRSAADLLLVPDFSAGQLTAYDVERERQSWSFDSGPGRDLYALLHHGGDLFCITVPASFGDRERGSVIEIEPRSGGRRERLQLGLGVRPLGIARGRSYMLPSPWLFLLGETRSGRALLEGLDLSSGRGWKRELRQSFEDLVDQNVAPVVTDGLAAVLWRTRDSRTRARREALLEFYDLDTGYRRGTKPLSRKHFPSAFALEMHALGASLWLGCLSSDAQEDKLEIWVQSR